MITIETIRSSMLKSISYDEVEEVLTIIFANGGEYNYFDVPKEIFNELINAESEGKYFTAHIKNKYKYEKV